MTDTPEETDRKRQLLKELIQAEQEAGLYDDVPTAEEAVEATKEARKELHEAREEAFQQGMAHAHEIVYQNIERMQQSLSDVMGIYMDMPSKLMNDHPSVAELEMGWRVLDQFKERFVDDYDDEFRKHSE